MFTSAESWSTQQLAEFVAFISASSNELEACQRAVERAAEALEAEVCALVQGDRVLAGIGFPEGFLPTAEDIEAISARSEHRELGGLGRLWTISTALDQPSDALLLGRMGEEGFSQEEADLLRGMGRALALTLRMLRTLDHERELRLASQREVRQRKKIERELAHQALHDPLTDLPNRNLLRDRAVRALEHSASSSSLVGALLVGLDHFKLVNESVGHAGGDELLIGLAARWHKSLSEGDFERYGCTVARTGGDEFAVLCENLDSEHDALAIAERLQLALRTPFAIDGEVLTVTASIGIAMSTAPAAKEVAHAAADDLLRSADVAMSRAKEMGRNRYEVFDEEMRLRLLDRVRIESELRSAIELGQLRLLYQPVVSIDDASIVTVEALARWEHPERGMLGPMAFIPIAEQSDLIVRLGQWVIEEACAQLKRWEEENPEAARLRVSVNVSARQLTPALVGSFRSALQAAGVEPDRIAVEITESLLIEQAKSSESVLAALKELGVGIVLDDFGTGYSSLSYLKSLPIDQLKLDRSFISSLVEDPRSAKIVSATIEMARALGLSVVAEGVETHEQLKVLQRLRCDYAQGFYFSLPEPPRAIAQQIVEASLFEPLEDFDAPAPVAAAVSPESFAAADDAKRRLFIGRVAGLFFTAGSAVIVPANLLLNRHQASLLLAAGLALLAFSSGVVCFLIRWERQSDRWIHGTALVATLQVILIVGTIGHPSVFSWFYVLIAVAAGYAFPGRRTLAGYALLLAGATLFDLITFPTRAVDALPGAVVEIAVLWLAIAATAALREQLEEGKAELRELAVRDPLTGIGNYRLLHDRLDYELRRHARVQRQFALLLIDLDRFKEVNERLGHAAGDEVLRRVARALSGVVRQQDTVARQGGDEFAVLAPETDRIGAEALARRIRERIAEVKIADARIGATIGSAVYAEDGGSAQTLLARADAQLIADKARTRGPAAELGYPPPAPAVVAPETVGAPAVRIA